MKPQTQGHVSGNIKYHKEDIKPDALLEKNTRSPSQYQDGDKMTYSEKEALKQLTDASSWPQFSGIGEYDHMELIDYIDGIFTTPPKIRNHKLLTKLPGDLEHPVKCRCSKESTLDKISITLKEVRIRTSIGRYNTHSTGDNRENPTLEPKETHDSESEITTGFQNCESPNHNADNFPKDREEISARGEEIRKDQEGHESDSDSVGNDCGNNSYSEPNLNEEYLVEFNHGTKEIGSFHFKRRKTMTKHLDGLKHKPPDRGSVTTRTLLDQGHMNHPSTS
ncbi:hypothetical protein O181_060993 [Austropuccinia psidii MF-1]|uniref:Uncharacterized protein n=1 Tax=Austropuccinia psidii MF-1 TaxID=1389203 RepID=A0A9Q3ELX2_9BASI|nr:hypothetical protein [Austropuccinia psidii MF-1]